MTLPDVGVLAGLALLDSTSTGTLTIPVVMLLQPRVRFSRVLGYLTAISLFYWGLGLALATVGARITASPGLRDALESRTAYAVQLVIGVALVASSYLVDEEAQTRRRARRGDRPSLTSRMMGTVLGPRARWDAVVVLALVAGLIEAASMLPYLGAIGLITRAGLPARGAGGICRGHGGPRAAPDDRTGRRRRPPQ